MTIRSIVHLALAARRSVYQQFDCCCHYCSHVLTTACFVPYIFHFNVDYNDEATSPRTKESRYKTRKEGQEEKSFHWSDGRRIVKHSQERFVPNKVGHV